MEKSYDEIIRLLELLKEKPDVFKGADKFLTDENTPVISSASYDLAKRVDDYSPENPLYIVAIGAITNVASAILLNPKLSENAVVIWLGGHALCYHDILEFNMNEDIAAARVVFSSGVPLVQLPCCGVVNSFAISGAELEKWFLKKNDLANYLAEYTIKVGESYAKGKPWSRVVWDVTAVAWLLNDDDRFMLSKVVPTHMPKYDGQYEINPEGLPMRYVYYIRRDNLFLDLVKKLTE